jgi:amino acid transporter/nucleotide-binding universal stress UspA family protein
MLVAESRPRTLKWYHSGALLFGDWGTSRLYVLGLTFFFTAHASVLYLAAVGVLMIAVAWAYIIVCRSFPEGGGVYSAARQLSPTGAVIGATLLLCGYIMTAAISVVEAFHYFGLPRQLTLPLSVVTIAIIGFANWFGARSAGRLALIIAIAAGAASLTIALAAIPFVPAGLRSMTWDARPPTDVWITFTRLCLAMAGIEAVANMTGVMREPVVRTARRTIWPVAIEVVFFNMLFGLALMGLLGLSAQYGWAGDTAGQLPDAIRYAADEVPEAAIQYRDVAMKILAIESSQYWIGPGAGSLVGKIAAVVFGLLLLSATNTAVMAMVSVLFAMGQDRELPPGLTRLNYSGVPWIGLIAACIAPLIVLAIVQDVEILAELYVIGVCGAVTTNILSCALNRHLKMKKGERRGMWVLGIFLAAITITIIITKPRATLFAGIVIGMVLATRYGLKVGRGMAPEPLPTPATGWLAEIRAAPVALDPRKPRIMLAARGRYQSEFAVDMARRRGAALFVIFVRTLRVMDVVPGTVPRVEQDPDAQEALGTTAMMAREAGVPFVPIYVTSTDIAEEILDYTVTYGCETLILGKSRRSVFSRRFAGDVVSRVAEHLPDNVQLILRAGDAPFIPGGRDDVEHVQRKREEPEEDVPPT